MFQRTICGIPAVNKTVYRNKDMDIKKATLGDDAALYNNREEKTEKQKWAEMNKKQRFDYFKSYYLRPIICIAIAAGFLVWILISIFKPKPDEYVKVVVNNFSYLNYQYLTDDFLERKQLDSKDNTLSFDITMNLDNDTASMQKLAVYVFAGDVDLIISGNAVFERYAPQGFMQPLDEYLDPDLFAELDSKGLIYYTEIVETEYDGSVKEVYETKPYGIYLETLDLFKEYDREGCKAMIGIVTNSKQTEHAAEFIKYLFEVNPPDVEPYTNKKR